MTEVAFDMNILHMVAMTVFCVYMSGWHLSKHERNRADMMEFAKGVAWIVACLVGWIVYLAIK
jgi:uncharacterized membrane protein